MTKDRLCYTLALVMACVACNRFGNYTLVSQEYGFSVTFPEKPNKLTDKNHEGLPKQLWTVYRSDHKDFYSAQATSYQEALPTEGWLPGKAVGDLLDIRLARPVDVAYVDDESDVEEHRQRDDRHHTYR